jgi:hypothetical protein
MANIEDNPGNFYKGRWIWFRISSDSDVELKTYFNSLSMSNKFDYIYAQYEHTPIHGLHLQGMCYSMQQITATQFKDILYPGIPVFGGLKSKTEIEDMKKYVHSQETQRSDLEPLQHGEFPILSKSATQQKNNKDEAINQLRQKLEAGMSIQEMKQYGLDNGYTQNQMESAIKNHNYALCIKQNQKMVDFAKTIQWKPWQKFLFDYMKAPINPREIFVILDTCGNSGKTFFMKYFNVLFEDITVNLTNGKTGDLMHIINKKIIVENIQINLPRSVHGNINYQAIEQAKDGEFCTTKYNSTSITRNPARMVIFTNKELTWEAMSLDRFKIMVLKGDDFTCFNYEEYIKMTAETFNKNICSTKVKSTL